MRLFDMGATFAVIVGISVVAGGGVYLLKKNQDRGEQLSKNLCEGINEANLGRCTSDGETARAALFAFYNAWPKFTAEVNWQDKKSKEMQAIDGDIQQYEQDIKTSNQAIEVLEKAREKIPTSFSIPRRDNLSEEVQQTLDLSAQWHKALKDSEAVLEKHATPCRPKEFLSDSKRYEWSALVFEDNLRDIRNAFFDQDDCFKKGIAGHEQAIAQHQDAIKKQEEKRQSAQAQWQAWEQALKIGLPENVLPPPIANVQCEKETTKPPRRFPPFSGTNNYAEDGNEELPVPCNDQDRYAAAQYRWPQDETLLRALTDLFENQDAGQKIAQWLTVLDDGNNKATLKPLCDYLKVFDYATFRREAACQSRP